MTSSPAASPPDTLNTSAMIRIYDGLFMRENFVRNVEQRREMGDGGVADCAASALPVISQDFFSKLYMQIEKT